jgi:hypothetical protein
LGSQGIGLDFRELVPRIDWSPLRIEWNVRSIHTREVFPVFFIFGIAFGVTHIPTILQNLLPASGRDLGGSMHPKRDFVQDVKSTKFLRVSQVKGRWILKLGARWGNPLVGDFVVLFRVRPVS